MPRIFISYRRDDSIFLPQELAQRLRWAFGEEDVFFDLSAIAPGAEFPEAIRCALATCTVQLIFIGPRWEGKQQDGRCRIDDPNDWVRHEIESGLARGIIAIPVLLGSARPLGELGLPASLEPLISKNWFAIDEGHEFNQQCQRLLSHLRKLLGSELAGKYRLVRKIGEGGMGEIWEAEQQSPVHRNVALKILKSESALAFRSGVLVSTKLCRVDVGKEIANGKLPSGARLGRSGTRSKPAAAASGRSRGKE